MTLIFVDCEAYGNVPALGRLTEFGAVKYPQNDDGSWDTFYGEIVVSVPSKDNPAVPEPVSNISDAKYAEMAKKVFERFDAWLKEVSPNEQPVFVSDNPAFDWQWISDGFWRYLGYNPFGHSGRRIGDFYAGLRRDFRKTQEWKKLRITKHDHHPVHDALGNAEAFTRLIKEL